LLEKGDIFLDIASVFAEILENSEAPYLIKIDVEGHEPVIFERLKQFLKSRKPKAIIFEFNEHIFNESINNSKDVPIFNILRQMGMIIYSIRRGTLIRPYLELLMENSNIPQSVDYIAVDEAKTDWLAERVRIRC
jgi:hypothetical protein